MLHALLSGGKLIGLYSDYDLCVQTMEGLIQNRFVMRNMITIKSYHENSMMSEKYTPNQEDDNISIASTTMTEEDEDLDSDMIKQKAAEKKKQMDLQYNLSILKKKKEQIEESQRTFEVNINLYNRFKKLMKNNPNFIIPEMFQDKFILMEQLENDNMLTWENFHQRYVPKDVETGYSKLFNSMPVGVPVIDKLNEMHNNMSETETEEED
jgi:hypothetical protein